MSGALRRAAAALLALGLSAAPAAAHVERIEVVRREPVLDGRAFGGAGAYERIVGRAHFAVDPSLAANAAITDVTLAPRDARGLVTFTADLYILRPVDAARGNGAALVEIANRGGKQLLPFFNRAGWSADPADPEHFGDGFLLRQGFTLVWVGWQFDVPAGAGRLTLQAPIARHADGRRIAGLVRADFVVSERTADRPLADGNHRPYPVLDRRDAANVVTVRDTEAGPRRALPRDAWAFARAVDGRPVPDATHVWLRDGFRPGRIHDVVWRAADPPLAGLGLAAVRDLVSHLRHAPDAPAPVRTAIGFGISQSGRFLRTFVHDGFNADEEGRRVFDGVLAHIAGAGRGGFNHRFAQPSRASTVLSALDFPNDVFPFTDAEQTDLATGARGGLLDRARVHGVVPKIVHTNSSSEYWSRAGSLVHATTDGLADVPLADSTRLYVFAGGQHVPAGFPPPDRHAGTLPQNPNDFNWTMRALVLALHRWTTTGEAPPPSVHPTVAGGTLVAPGALRFPALPAVPRPPAPYVVRRADFGPRAAAGVPDATPVVGAPYALLVPQVDADGNELGALRMPEVAVPLATYTPWNPRRAELGFGHLTVGLTGGWIPFAATRADRERTGDPRPSVAERYAGRADYLARYAAAADALVRDGYLLAADVPALLRLAAERWDAVVPP